MKKLFLLLSFCIAMQSTNMFGMRRFFGRVGKGFTHIVTFRWLRGEQKIDTEKLKSLGLEIVKEETAVTSQTEEIDGEQWKIYKDEKPELSTMGTAPNELTASNHVRQFIEEQQNLNTPGTDLTNQENSPTSSELSTFEPGFQEEYLKHSTSDQPTNNPLTTSTRGKNSHEKEIRNEFGWQQKEKNEKDLLLDSMTLVQINREYEMSKYEDETDSDSDGSDSDDETMVRKDRHHEQEVEINIAPDCPLTPAAVNALVQSIHETAPGLLSSGNHQIKYTPQSIKELRQPETMQELLTQDNEMEPDPELERFAEKEAQPHWTRKNMYVHMHPCKMLVETVYSYNERHLTPPQEQTVAIPVELYGPKNKQADIWSKYKKVTIYDSRPKELPGPKNKSHKNILQTCKMVTLKPVKQRTRKRRRKKRRVVITVGGPGNIAKNRITL